MKIAQVITGSDSIGGGQTHVRDLSQGLAARGHSCTILVGPPDGLFSKQLRDLDLEIKLLPHLEKPIHPVRDSLALLELLKALRELKPDIVAAHTAKAGYIGRIAAALLRIPCVFTAHGVSIVNRATGKIDPLFTVLERVGGILLPGLITVCRDEQRLACLHRMIAKEKVFVVYNGIPDHPPPPGPQDEEVILLMIARFQKQKDHASLLEALALIKDYPWRLQLVGSGPLLEKMRTLAASLNLLERVDFLGEVPETLDLIDKASIFILSTFWEAFPISVLEGMRAGLPLVATNVGGIGEAVTDGVNGLLIPSSRPDLLAAGLKRLIIDRDLRQQLGQRARQDSLAYFTADRMVDRTLQVYGALIRHESATALMNSANFLER